MWSIYGVRVLTRIDESINGLSFVYWGLFSRIILEQIMWRFNLYLWRMWEPSWALWSPIISHYANSQWKTWSWLIINFCTPGRSWDFWVFSAPTHLANNTWHILSNFLLPLTFQPDVAILECSLVLNVLPRVQTETFFTQLIFTICKLGIVIYIYIDGETSCWEFIIKVI